MKHQIAEHTATLPSLRIAYKNQTVSRRKKKAQVEQKSIESPVQEVVQVKEPLPLFNDYRIKARDYDPL